MDTGDAWSWVDEGTPDRPKLGYVTTTPGAELHIEVSVHAKIVHSGLPVALRSDHSQGGEARCQ